MPGLKTQAEDLALRRQSRRTTGLLGSSTTPPAPADDDIERSRLAAHPANWRTTLGDVSDLVQSMKTVGILEPLVVTTRAAHLAAWPDHADKIGNADYVVICGHRRLAAAEVAHLERLPAIIRPELSADGKDVEAMVIENARRQNFDPLDEARAFAELRRRGRLQEDIAAAVGCSQPYVSKRLKLLALADPVRDAFAAGLLRVNDALAIGDLKDPERQIAAWETAWKITAAEPRPTNNEDDDEAQDERLGEGKDKPKKPPVVRSATVAAAVAEQRQLQSVAKRTAESHAQAKKEQVPLVDAVQQFGGDVWRQRLDSPDAIAAARSAGTLTAAVDESGGLYYLTTETSKATGEQPQAETPDTVVPSPTVGGIAPPAPRQAIPAQKNEAASTELTNAARNRQAACVQLIGRKPAAAEALRRLAAAVVTLAASREALRLAHSWLQEAGLTEADASRHADAVAVRGGDEAVAFGFAIALAADELHTRRVQQEWDARAAAHVRRLMAEAKYVPTAIEARLLNDL